MIVNLQNILLIAFAAINILSFLILAYDKRKARLSHGHRRTSEGFIFFLATAFGSIGVYLGMYSFRHKTRKWYFQIGIPLLILQNIATIYLIRIL